MKHERDPAENDTAAPRALPIDPATGEVYIFDTDSATDRAALHAVLGGSRLGQFTLAAEIQEDLAAEGTGLVNYYQRPDAGAASRPPTENPPFNLAS